MKVHLVDYQGKGLGLAPLLEQAGHELTTDDICDVLLIDCDFPWAGDRVAMIEQAHDFGAKVAVYPHGGEPLHFYDGICGPHPDVDALLVTGPGHTQFQSRFGHKRVVEIGWYWCQQKPLAGGKVRSVLFAPMHPWGDGRTIAPQVYEANRAAFEAACELGLPVTVRVLGHPEASGADQRPGVRFTQGSGSIRDAVDAIGPHDLVVAAGTFAALALARGKPVVMLPELEPHDDWWQKPAATWPDWRGETRYPLCVGDDSMAALVARARAGEGQGWRERFVGSQATVESLQAAILSL